MKLLSVTFRYGTSVLALMLAATQISAANAAHSIIHRIPPRPDSAESATTEFAEYHAGAERILPENAGAAAGQMVGLDSPGAQPEGLLRGPAGPGAVVINEIMQNPAATTDETGEWFELYNATSRAIDINGWTLRDADADSHRIDNGGPLVVAPGGYAVLGSNSDRTTNGGVRVQYVYSDTWHLANGSDEIILVDGVGTEIDRVMYDGGTTFPAPEGASMALVHTAQDNHVGSSWCVATTPYGPGDRGTPGAANDCAGGGDNPPTVRQTTPVHGVAQSATDITITFSENVTVREPWATLTCSQSGAVPVASSGGPQSYTLSPLAELAGDEQCTVTVLANHVTDQDGAPHAPAEDYSFTLAFGSAVASCGEPATRIHQIQGSGVTYDPLFGGVQTIQGVVTGDFPGLGGFYVQEEAGDYDGDPATSEGIFVFLGNNYGISPVTLNNIVRVTGEVREYTTGNGASSQTQIGGSVNILDCGSNLSPVTPINLTLPLATENWLERLEGMRVRLSQPLVIAEYTNFDRTNEIALALPLGQNMRPFQPTSMVEPGPGAADQATQNRLRRILLDDGRNVQNPAPLRHPNGGQFSLSNRFRGGDTVTDVVGVVDETGGHYRVQPTGGATHTVVNPRSAVPEAVGGSLQVAAFNTQNYFLTLDAGMPVCGPAGNQPCSGADADQPLEFERQRTKVITTLLTLNADVVGLLTLENTTGVEPMQDMVAGLNAEVGAGAYAYVHTGTIGTHATKVGLLYKPAFVTPVGPSAVLHTPTFVDPMGTGSAQNKPALAQTFRSFQGGIFTVVVTDLKARAVPCGVGDDDAQQGNCNGTRALGAAALMDWLATDPTGSGDGDYLILGDLNAYDKEAPVDAVRAGTDDAVGTGDDYTDLVALFQGEPAYSHLDNAQFGYLEYALSAQSLASQVTGVTVWHINADEPDLLNYDTSQKPPAQDALYEPNAFRSSDHDPVLLGLNLQPDTATAINQLLTMSNVRISYNPIPAPNAPAGVYTVYTTYINQSAATIHGLYFLVVKLTGGNLVLNADGGPGGVGSTVSVPASALGANGMLDPGESVQVAFRIGMQSQNSFDFFVDAYGILDAVVAAQQFNTAQGFYLGATNAELMENTPDSESDNRLYLPTVAH